MARANEPRECARWLQALADPTRLSVVDLLLQGAKTVGELNLLMRIEQSLLSHHLMVLRARDLVRSERRGRSVVYRISPRVRRATESGALDFGCCRLSFS